MGTEQLTERTWVQKINITWLREEWLANPEQAFPLFKCFYPSHICKPLADVYCYLIDVS